MHKKNILKSTLTGMIGYIFSTIIGFFSRAIFIRCLGSEYAGINGLFGNILGVLTIIETGFGTAIIVNLYKEIANDNKENIKSLLQFYRKIYSIIALIIAIIGIIISFFVNIIVGEVSIPENLQFIFLLCLFDTVMTYLFTYKRSILIANQQNYYINIVDILYSVLMNSTEIVYLLLTKNFIGYLLIKILFRLGGNILISLIANKKYPYIKEKNIKPLDKVEKASIYKKVKGLFFHRMGGFIVLGTDNIIISVTKSLGIIVVGLYSNYYLIINVLQHLMNHIFVSLSGGVGRLLVENDKKKSYSVFKTIFLMNSWIYSYVAISFYFVSKPFVEIWIGTEYILSSIVVFVLTINLYITGLRCTFGIFKDSAGIFYEDRIIPVIESIVNIVASLIFVHFFGLAGVFLGTITSTMVIYFYTFPKYVYKRLLGQGVKQYAKDVLKNVAIFAISFVAVYIVSLFIKIQNVWILLIVNILICIIIPNLIYWIFMHKTKEYLYYKDLIIKVLRKLKNRKQNKEKEEEEEEKDKDKVKEEVKEREEIITKTEKIEGKDKKEKQTIEKESKVKERIYKSKKE